MKPSEESLQTAAQCWCDPTTSDRVMDEKLAVVFATKLDEVKAENKEVRIGEFMLVQKGYADQFWINRLDGEGMAVSGETLKELETLITDFYKRRF